jgi:enamine deaminase RidA (YjgF/YER057c/UK114 family)
VSSWLEYNSSSSSSPDEHQEEPRTQIYQYLVAMSAPKFTIYPGLGEWARDNLHYSQAVRIGNTIKISSTKHQTNPRVPSPGGWNPSADQSDPSTWISSDLNTEIDQAFANVELALKSAGGKGWSQVYSIRSYHLPADEATTSAMVRNLQQYCGTDHRPIWTEIGVATLGLPTMRVEIEVEAFLGEE